VVKTLLQTSETARYSFALYGIDQPFSPAPGLTFSVASWDINYQGQDTILPGIVASRLTIQVFDGLSLGEYRTIISDAEGRYIMVMREGLNIVYQGLLVPDLCEIELLNGQRFIKLEFTDGFQTLERKADFFVTNAVRNHTSIIGEIFTACKLNEIFTDGFFVGEHYQPINSISGFTNQGGLFVTGTPREGLIFEGVEARSCREVITDICTTFNLQLFQDKGSLVFRTCHIKTPAWYNLYNYLGTFLGRITPPATTQTEEVYSDGTEMYRPAIAEGRLQHPYSGSPFIWYVPGNYLVYDNTQIGNPVSDGTTEIDYNGTLRITYSLPAFFGPAMVEVDWVVTFQYDGFWWDGSAWVNSPATVKFNKKFTAENPSPDPALFTEEFTVNNYKLDDVPALGSEPFYFTVEAEQVAGLDIGDLNPTATAIFEYKAGAPQYIIYIADNSARINGTTVDLNTSLGDIRQEPVSGLFTVLPGSIRYFASVPPSGNGLSNAFWDASRNELGQLVIDQITRKAYQPQQYYEIELDGNVSYNHTFTWDAVDYKPVNLTMSERSTRVTYRAFIDGDLKPDGK
jgi:hypothetical protein